MKFNLQSDEQSWRLRGQIVAFGFFGAVAEDADPRVLAPEHFAGINRCP